MARHRSFYRHEFVEDMLAHSDGNNAVQNDIYYVRHRHELANWWSNELWKNLNPSNKQQHADLSGLIMSPEPTGLFRSR